MSEKQSLNAAEGTAAAVAVCLALIVAGYWLLLTANLPTSRLGRAPSEREILLYDVILLIAAGYVIGLAAMAITRFIFPKSSIKVIFYVIGPCTVLFALFYLKLMIAIGESNSRDVGALVSFFVMLLGMVTWAVISWRRAKREAP